MIFLLFIHCACVMEEIGQDDIHSRQLFVIHRCIWKYSSVL